jgi:hypothetical protein
MTSLKRDEIVASPPNSAYALTPFVKGLATLAAVGAVVGGALGTIMLGAMQVRAPGGLSWIDVPFSLMFGGTFGAAVGGVAAPIFASLLLRRATVGQAILWTGIGTIAGVLATPLIGGRLTLNGCLGFALSSVLLSVYSRRVG